MILRLPCQSCGELIHPDTASKNGGLCMPCKGGYRARIEEGKRRREEEREFDKSPGRLYWLEVVRRVHTEQGGVATLEPAEQTYYALRCLLGEVYNGGFFQFFSNHSGELYGQALDGLLELQANRSYVLLSSAKELLFGSAAVPQDFSARNALLPELESLDSETEKGKQLDALEKEFWSDPEGLDLRCSKFANAHGLYRRDA